MASTAMTEEKTFVGYGWGTFDVQEGRQTRQQRYCNVFLLESFAGEENADYHFGGVKAVKYGCKDPSVFADIEINSQVLVYFDSKGKVAYMDVASPKAPAKAPAAPATK